MSNENKVLRISADVDSSITNAIPQALQNITRAAKDAAEALAAVNQRMGGGGGGSPFTVGGVGAGGAAAAPAGFGGAQSTLKASENPQVLALKETAKEAQSAGRAMQDNFRGVEPILRTLASSIQGILEGMRQIRTQSGDITGSAPFSSAIEPNRPRMQAGAQYGAYDTDVQRAPGAYNVPQSPFNALGPAWARNVRRYGVPHASDEEAAMGGGGAGESGGAGGGAGGKGGMLGMLSGVPGLGRLAGLATGAGLAYAAYKAVDFGTQAFANIDVANDTEALQNTHFYSSRLRAAAGQTFGRNATRLLGGDLGWARAMSLADADPEAAAMRTPDMLDTRLELAGHRAGLTRIQNDATGQMLNTSSGFTMSNMRNQFSQAAQQSTVELIRPAEASRLGTLIGVAASKGMEAPKLGETIGKAAGLGELTQHGQLPHVEKPSLGGYLKYLASEENLAHYDMGDLPEFSSTHRTGNKTVAEIKMIQDKAKIPIEMAQERQQRIQNEYEADPMFNLVAGNLMSGAMGTLAATRTSGISNKAIFKNTGSQGFAGGPGQRFIGYGHELFEQRMIERGFSGAEGDAALAAMGRLAGRGNMGLGTGVMGAQAGGLFNAAELVGTGAQMGGQGGPMALYRAVQGAIGAGGMDITAGAEISGVMAKMLEAGHGGVGGIGGGEAMASIMAAAHVGGATAGEDMRAGRMMAGGLQQQGALFGGKTDALGQALTRRAALRGAGGNPYKADALERLLANPVEMQQILQTGRVPAGLESLGITAEMVQTADKESNLQLFTRTVSRGLDTSTAGGKFATLLKSTGTVKDAQQAFLQQELGDKDLARLTALREGNVKGKERAELERRADAGLRGEAEIMTSDNGKTADENYEFLRNRLGLKGTGKGRGAGWAASGLEKGAARTQAQLKNVEMFEKFQAAGEIEKAEKFAASHVGVEQAARKHMAETPEGQATNLAITVRRVNDALDMLATKIETVAGKKGVKTSSPDTRK